MILLAGLPALVMGLAISSFGNPLSGLFAVGIGLCSLAVAGGEMDEWVRRSTASLPGDYFKLVLETLVWFAAVIAFLTIALKVRPAIRKSVPKLSDEHHCGRHMRLFQFDKSSWTAGGVTALIGGVLAFLLLRNAESGQVVGGLILAFMIAAFVGMLVAGSLFGEPHPRKGSDKIDRMVAPPRNPVPIMLAPAAVAIIGYLLTFVAFSDQNDLLASWHTGGVVGIARALPIHYASAGVIGCCLGVGWAQAVAGDSSAPDAAKKDEDNGDTAQEDKDERGEVAAT